MPDLGPPTDRVSILLVGTERLQNDLEFLDEFRPAAQVLIVPGLRDALHYLKANPVDVLISEEVLPDGAAHAMFEEIGKLARLGKPPAMFVLSDAPMATQTELARRYPQVDGIFFRPFDENVLMTAVFASLRRRSQSTRVSGARLSVDNVSVELMFKGAKAARKATLGNLGRGGMFLVIEDPLPREGDTFTFKIVAERGRQVKIEGKGVVRWIRVQSLPGMPRGVGTQFSQVVGDSLRDLLDLIKNLKKGSGSPSDRATG